MGHNNVQLNKHCTDIVLLDLDISLEHNAEAVHFQSDNYFLSDISRWNYVWTHLDSKSLAYIGTKPLFFQAMDSNTPLYSSDSLALLICLHMGKMFLQGKEPLFLFLPDNKILQYSS